MKEKILDLVDRQHENPELIAYPPRLGIRFPVTISDAANPYGGLRFV